MKSIIERNKHIILLLLMVFVMSCARDADYPPILLLATDNGFGTYTGEILKAEGFNEFQIDSIKGGRLTSSFLNKFDILIVAESKVDLNTKNKLSNFIRKGGNLIAVRPDSTLQEFFGIRPDTGKISNGFIIIDTANYPGQGLTGRPIQLHGVADRYSLNGSKAIASLTTDQDNYERTPAVVEYNYGKGHTMAFTYNLPENIVLTRQGNPDYAATEKDGIPGIRAMDMFTDGWVLTSNNVINQADEQMHLLSRCIVSMCTRPLPRLWYFPDNLNSFITITNDGEFMNESDFEPQFRDLDSMNAKMTLYVLDADKVSAQWVEKWTQKGFEISGHPDNVKNAADPGWDDMNQALTHKIKEINNTYGLSMRTVVNHWFVWCGKDRSGYPEFAAQAEIEEMKGILMDINYAHYDNNSNQGHFLGFPGTNQGNFTGSGIPMKFANSKGKVLNIYQHLNNVYDQQYKENNDTSGFFDCFRGLLDRSLDNEVYSFISIKSHNDEYYFSRGPLLRMLNYARLRNVPVTTAIDLLDFLKTKDETLFTGISWADDFLTFKINSHIDNNHSLTVMLPAEFEGKMIKFVSVNQERVQITKRSVKREEYILFTVTPGKTHDIAVSFAIN